MIEYTRYAIALVLILSAVYVVRVGAQQQTFGATNTISSVSTSTIYGGLNLTHGCVTQNGGSCVGPLTNLHQVAKGTAGPTANNSAGSVSIACDTGRIVTCMASSTSGNPQPFLQSAYYDVPNNQCTATYACGGSGCVAATISVIADCAN